MSSHTSQADRYAQAVLFIHQEHAGTFRDDGKTPYAVHPLRVSEYLRRIAGETDEEVLCAALLHDVIEDCGVTYDDVASRFGDGVAQLVAELTNDNRLPKNRRKAAMLEKLPTISARAKRVKLADRLDNVLDLLRGMGSAEKRQRYEQETERLLQACSGACGAMEEALNEALQKLKAVNRQTQPAP
ncbi:MAG TPA: HD domain-containing protein [Planctomycetota bacterium]|nr:HD domain-containing protein [Planctomycetota bacterium]